VIDDPGTGCSSSSRLVGLPVSYAEIDRHFVACLPQDPRVLRGSNPLLQQIEGICGLDALFETGA
jgi:EAL domain-containing protein (putative c-di-GMP-specific phosphodiesterase class I)